VGASSQAGHLPRAGPHVVAVTVADFLDRYRTLQLTLGDAGIEQTQRRHFPGWAGATASGGVGVAPRHGTSRKLLNASCLALMIFAF
jgi:hypothetical protein